MKPLLLATKPATPVLWAGLALVLLGLVPAVGQADAILGNLVSGDGGFRTLDQNDFAAYGFTMGSQAYSLSDVQLRLRFPTSDTIFTLESDATIGPSRPSGTNLALFANPNFQSGTHTYTFPASAFTLAPNTTYWLVGRTSSIFNTGWQLTNFPNIPMGSGATFTLTLFPMMEQPGLEILPRHQNSSWTAHRWAYPSHRPGPWSARSPAWPWRSAGAAGEPAALSWLSRRPHNN